MKIKKIKKQFSCGIFSFSKKLIRVKKTIIKICLRYLRIMRQYFNKVKKIAKLYYFSLVSFVRHLFIYLYKRYKKIIIYEIKIPVLLIIYVIFGVLVSFSAYKIFDLIKIKTQSEANIHSEISFIPQRIEINRFSLDLPIKSASVSENEWQVYDDAVSWLNSSADLSGGNIILYGHNKKTILGNIIQLVPGDKIKLSNGNMEKYFTVEKVYQTNREDLSALKSEENQLTIYTCSGWFDVNRFFVIAYAE